MERRPSDCTVASSMFRIQAWTMRSTRATYSAPKPLKQSDLTGALYLDYLLNIFSMALQGGQ